MAQNRVVRNIPRASPEVIAGLREAGVATVHEAAGRIGLLGTRILPRMPGSAVAGSAVTVSSHPGDNLMIHAAVEVCQPGDILVVTTTADSKHGMFGDLLATSLKARGVIGMVTDAGVRDIATLRQMDFPIWSRAVHSQGTVKATAGSVNIPVIAAGQLVNPGDVIIADDDGVVAIPASLAAQVLDAAIKRVANEEAKRVQFEGGELGLDLYNLRPLLDQLGVVYVDDIESA